MPITITEAFKGKVLFCVTDIQCDYLVGCTDLHKHPANKTETLVLHLPLLPVAGNWNPLELPGLRNCCHLPDRCPNKRYLGENLLCKNQIFKNLSKSNTIIVAILARKVIKMLLQAGHGPFPKVCLRFHHLCSVTLLVPGLSSHRLHIHPHSFHGLIKVAIFKIFCPRRLRAVHTQFGWCWLSCGRHCTFPSWTAAAEHKGFPHTGIAAYPFPTVYSSVSSISKLNVYNFDCYEFKPFTPKLAVTNTFKIASTSSFLGPPVLTALCSCSTPLYFCLTSDLPANSACLRGIGVNRGSFLEIGEAVLPEGTACKCFQMFSQLDLHTKNMPTVLP